MVGFKVDPAVQRFESRTIAVFALACSAFEHSISYPVVPLPRVAMDLMSFRRLHFCGYKLINVSGIAPRINRHSAAC